MALKCSGDWPQRPDSILLMKLRAAVGDLRQLQGFLASVGQQECDMPTLSQQDAWLSSLAAEASSAVEMIGSRLDIALEEFGTGDPIPAVPTLFIR